MTTAYLVIYQNLPTYSMYFRDDVYSEPISTVNSQVIGVYKTYHKKAEKAAKDYFLTTLGHEDSGDSENGGYHFRDEDGDSGTWEEEVFIESMALE